MSSRESPTCGGIVNHENPRSLRKRSPTASAVCSRNSAASDRPSARRSRRCTAMSRPAIRSADLLARNAAHLTAPTRCCASRTANTSSCGRASAPSSPATPKAIEAIQRAPEHYMQRPDKDYGLLDPTRTSLSGLLADDELQPHQRDGTGCSASRRFTTAWRSRRIRSAR